MTSLEAWTQDTIADPALCTPYNESAFFTNITIRIKCSRSSDLFVVRSMKVIVLFLVLAIQALLAVQAFVVAPHGCAEKRSAAVLHMGWFDKAFHGGGSANQEELDEIYRTQQAILAARRGETKEHMKQKYKEPRKFEVKATKEAHSEGGEMYVQVDKKARKKAASAGDKAGGGAFKMPWDK